MRGKVLGSGIRAYLTRSLVACALIGDMWAGEGRAASPAVSSKFEGGIVDERSRVLGATFLGALVGGLWGWLYLTENGRRIRDQIEPKLDNLVNEIGRVRGTVEKARTAANEGLRSLNDVTGGSHGRWSA
jgi:hypothetical protein